jgi:hypothetical protein
VTKTTVVGLIVVAGLTSSTNAAELDSDSEVELAIPVISEGTPAAGKRVRVTSPEYVGTEVYHTIYLPEDWRKSGRRLPIIFEYTGNFFPQSGSTGEVKDAGLGYGLSGGKYIWVSLPYIRPDGKSNEVTWWGDVDRTIQYAKTNVPRIIEEYGGDPSAVFLCGFSRGAIGVNYLGLHDDEIACLWTAFISHDHFDGVRAWGRSDWGSPLEKYRVEAAERLKRVGGRPYLVIQNGKGYGTDAFVRSVLPRTDNFTFIYIDARAIFGSFPNEMAKSGHTDRWPLKPSEYRAAAWQWMNDVTAKRFERARNLQ